MHRVTQNLVGEGEVLVISMPGKKFQNGILACALKKFWHVPPQKYPIITIL
jgi:hypothetical protein